MDLLRALSYQHGAVGLRQLARLADVHPHSAERALGELVEEGLVERQDVPARALFRQSPHHTDWHLLKAVFDAGDRAVRGSQQAMLNRRGRSILPFIEEATGMLSRARKRSGVS